jgi:FkbM family methyltransferase
VSDDILTIRVAGRSYKIHDPGGHIGRPLRGGRPYEQKMLDEIRRLRLEGTALDVGAHVGNHALYLAAICGLSVWAFEPHEESYERLAANIDLNKDDLSVDVAATQAALGTHPHQAEWHPDKKMTLRPLESGQGVPVVPFDELPCPADLSLVKMDVEGMEPLVMEGMQATLRMFKPVVYAEAHDGMAVNAQRAVMSKIGYRLDHYVHMGSRMACWRAR